MEYRIQKHDQQQFEIKLSYPLARERRQDSYKVEIFLFIPYQLGVNESRYTTAQFYSDLNCHTRFKTPVLTLPQLLDPVADANPLARVVRKLDDAKAGRPLDERGVRYELKVLGNVIRVQVRDRSRALVEAVRGKRAPAVELASEIRGLAAETARALDAMRRVEQEMGQQYVTPGIRRTYRWVDEYLSMETEGHLIHLLRNVELHGNAELEPVRAELAEAVRREAAHRATLERSRQVSTDSRRNEKFLYREALLKKFCANVLFLNVEQRVGDQRARTLVYGIAAGVAMAFAAGAALIAAKYWSQQSAAFVIVLILAYILKDRIKELVKEYGGRLVPRWACDRTGLLVDPQSDRTVGRSRERMRRRDSDALPKDVIAGRRFLYELEREVCGKTDNVIHYVKELEIKTDEIYAVHQRSVAIDDILRINVGRWLERMDNPWEELILLPDGGGRTETTTAPRVYHVNIVARLEGGGHSSVETARLVMDRSGIVRVETGR